MIKQNLKALAKSSIFFGSKVLIVFLAIFCLFLLILGYLDKYSLNYLQRNTMIVRGEASEYVVPDQATLVFGLEIKGNNAVEMQNSLNNKLNKFLSDIEKIGINKEQITTSSFEFVPSNNSYKNDKDEVLLVLSSSVTIKFEGVDKDASPVSQVINLAFSNGLNKIQSLYYSVSKQEEISKRLKEKAIENAKKEKEFLEQKTGVKLGTIRRVDVDNSFYPPIYRNVYSMDAMSSSPIVDSSVSPNLQINPGKQELTKYAVLEYEIL